MTGKQRYQCSTWTVQAVMYHCDNFVLLQFMYLSWPQQVAPAAWQLMLFHASAPLVPAPKLNL